jgi:hypothetical protein
MGVLYKAVRSGWMATITEDVERVVARPPISFGEFAKTHTDTW